MNNKRYTLDGFLRERKEGKVSDIHDYVGIGDTISEDLAMYLLGYSPERWEKATSDGKMVSARSEHVSDIIGGTPLYETVGRWFEGDANYAYFGLCDRETRINRHPALMDKVYICSAFRSADEEELTFNRNFAAAMCRNLFEQSHCIPVAPHLYFPQFLIESDEFERGFGMEAGTTFLDKCDWVYVCKVDSVVSRGMRQEIEYAQRKGIPIRVRNQSKEVAQAFVSNFLKDIRGTGAEV